MEDQCVCTAAGCDFFRWPFWSAGRQQQSDDTALARRADCLTALRVGLSPSPFNRSIYLSATMCILDVTCLVVFLILDDKEASTGFDTANQLAGQLHLAVALHAVVWLLQGWTTLYMHGCLLERLSQFNWNLLSDYMPESTWLLNPSMWTHE